MKKYSEYIQEYEYSLIMKRKQLYVHIQIIYVVINHIFQKYKLISITLTEYHYLNLEHINIQIEHT